MRQHPSAAVPATLFDDPDREQRWRARFSATRISLPGPARDAPHRASYVSNETGRYELYCWDVTAGPHMIATDRPDGTVHGALSADGDWLWWFDDDAGDEFGSWRRQPFGAAPAPAQAEPALPDVDPGYPAGLEVGRDVVLAGFSDDGGSRVHLARSGQPAAVVYRHPNDAGVGALATDERVWVLSHSERGDSRYPALRAFALVEPDDQDRRNSDPSDPVPPAQVLGELDDGPGRGLAAIAFSPVPGDQRLLVGHERRGREELLLWDVATGAVTELAIDLPGDLAADFFLDGQALAVVHTHGGRASLHRYDLSSGALTELPAARGVVSGAVPRPDGSVWYRWSNAAEPGQLRVIRPVDDGHRDETLLLPPGGAAPSSEAVEDVFAEGPGGRIHALLARPAGAADADAPLPTVCYLHGGPADADEDSYDATRAAWLDAGYAVVQVNYRGSTGYGSQWRDALAERLGHTELADVAAVHDHLIERGVVDPARSVVVGYSWGGFLALLALGSQPGRWAAGVAGVPVADYVAAYEDEMEPLRAYDRALFGGSPEDVPDRYRDSSPITYVDHVSAPVLILAGENDPRCPIRQIDLYLDALAQRGASYAQYRYEAGHGSMVVDERLRQVACEIAFVREALDRRPVGAAATA